MIDFDDPDTSNVIVFNDPTYPQSCSESTIATLVPTPYLTVNANELAEMLASEKINTLISFQGPYFPKQAWIAVSTFLEEGGNLIIFGGMPFSRPVKADGSIEPEQEAYAVQLFLGPFFKVQSISEQLHLIPAPGAVFLEDFHFCVDAKQTGDFWSFYPKLTQTSDYPEDLGSAGPLDTVLTPLLYATRRIDETGVDILKVATPALLMDQHSGKYAGGRWLLSTWKPGSEDVWLENSSAIRAMISLGLQGMNTLNVRPVFATYSPGENPEIIVSVRSRHNLKATLTASNSGFAFADKPGTTVTLEIEIEGSQFRQEKCLPIDQLYEPGLYQIEVVYQFAGDLTMSQHTGFWVWDQSLVESTKGQSLKPGRDYFYQNDRPFLVFGTTYMDSVVQRKFLTLPNPWRWDIDFAEMKARHINLIRTGIWTGWQELMPLNGILNESMLRALDAFVLTACKYNIQVIFNFFAFYPPLFGGENPWLDPRSIEGQQNFVRGISSRYAGIEILSWDLINEPSFGSPHRIFSQRPKPNHDRFELAAFQEWLKKRFTLNELQLKWRLTPIELKVWEDVKLPQAHDYSTDVRDNTSRNMFLVADYTLFSQDMFREWALTMYKTIREAGSQTLVGVGQDEAGARISPQYYAKSVDYTTTHPWWNNDALFWDMLMDKTPDKPNLIQETGVMLVRDVDNRPWRSEQENANLLERKLFTSLTVRSAGMIQWLWHTNAYMTSDNENSIGLLRADGSAKPEMSVMQQFGKLSNVLAPLLLEPGSMPDVLVVVPYSQWFVRPDLGISATQNAVRLLGYEFGIVPQLLGEHQLAELALQVRSPLNIILPSVQLFSEAAWTVLQKLVKQGSTLLVSGVISQDQHNLFFDNGLETEFKDVVIQPVSRFENLEQNYEQENQLIYGGEKIGYLKKAHNKCLTFSLGKGKVVWVGLPLELSMNPEVIKNIYRNAFALKTKVETERKVSPVLVVTRDIKDGQLVVIVSESSSSNKIRLSGELSVEIAPGRAGAVLLRAGYAPQLYGGLSLVTTPLRPKTGGI